MVFAISVFDAVQLIVPADKILNVKGSVEKSPYSSTLHPLGIPLVPVFQDVMPAAFTNVPVEATPDTQLFVQPVAEISVAKHLM